MNKFKVNIHKNSLFDGISIRTYTKKEGGLIIVWDQVQLVFSNTNEHLLELEMNDDFFRRQKELIILKIIL